MGPGRLLWIGFSLLGFETQSAERRVISALSTPPEYQVDGPLVSVVIPAYNEEKYLESTLTAIENQTYSNIEVVVVDNESEDNTVEIAKSHGARVISSPEFNIAGSRNMGADASSGDIIAFVDADTLLEHKAIEKAVEKIGEGAVLVYANTCCQDNYAQSIGRVFGGLFLAGTLVGTSGHFLVVNRGAFNQIGGFDEEYFDQVKAGEDTKLGVDMKNWFGRDRIAYLRRTYTATSARRQLKEGFFPESRERSIRERTVRK